MEKKAVNNQILNRLKKQKQYVENDDGRVIVGIFRDDTLEAYVIANDNGDSMSVHINPIPILIVLLLVALLAWPFSRSVTRPVETLSTVVQRFGLGDLKARVNSIRQDEVGALSHRFDAMADRMEMLIQQERNLLASISHEFRTPLQRLKLFLELLEDRELLEADEVSAVNADINELDGLVADVMFAAKLQQGTVESSIIQLASTDLISLISSGCERFRALYPNREIVMADIAPPLHGMVDGRLMIRVLSNLLHNAHKYSPRDAQIEVELKDDGEMIELRILDKGSGVPSGYSTSHF